MNAAADGGKGVVRLTRTLPAPPAEVYQAFPDPDVLRQWFGPARSFTARDGHLHSAGGPGVAYRVAPATAYGFGKTTPSQTRWTFG